MPDQQQVAATPTPRKPRRETSAAPSQGGLWAVVLFFLALVGAGAALWLPRLFPDLHGDMGFVMQVMIGLLVLGAFCLHLLSQHVMLREVSSALLTATSYIDRLENFSFVDPATQLFNRRYLDHLFNQQLKWLNRCGKPALILVFEVKPQGQTLSSEEMVIETAYVLRSNFRGSDYVVRNSHNQFLVLLPDTNEEQAQFALNRLADKVDSWNLENNGSEIIMRYEMTICVPGGDLWSALQETEQKLRQARKLTAEKATVLAS